MNCTIRDRRLYTKDVHKMLLSTPTEAWIVIGRRNAQIIRAKRDVLREFLLQFHFY